MAELAVGVHVRPGQLLLPHCPGSVWVQTPTLCLPSAGEQGGWWDKERDLLDDLKAISCVGFPKGAEVGVPSSLQVGWVPPPSSPCCLQPLQPAEACHLNQALQGDLVEIRIISIKKCLYHGFMLEKSCCDPRHQVNSLLFLLCQRYAKGAESGKHKPAQNLSSENLARESGRAMEAALSQGETRVGLHPVNNREHCQQRSPLLPRERHPQTRWLEVTTRRCKHFTPWQW